MSHAYPPSVELTGVLVTDQDRDAAMVALPLHNRQGQRLSSFAPAPTRGAT
jgi:hypothetical protein